MVVILLVTNAAVEGLYLETYGQVSLMQQESF
jgi:hypothetical protein